MGSVKEEKFTKAAGYDVLPFVCGGYCADEKLSNSKEEEGSLFFYIFFFTNGASCVVVAVMTRPTERRPSQGPHMLMKSFLCVFRSFPSLFSSSRLRFFLNF